MYVRDNQHNATYFHFVSKCQTCNVWIRRGFKERRTGRTPPLFNFQRLGYSGIYIHLYTYSGHFYKYAHLHLPLIIAILFLSCRLCSVAQGPVFRKMVLYSFVNTAVLTNIIIWLSILQKLLYWIKFKLSLAPASKFKSVVKSLLIKTVKPLH